MVAALFIFLSVAFISYNPADNTLFHYSSTRVWTANLAGVVGANIAGLFFYLFGSAAYLFLLSLLIPVYFIFFKNNKESLNPRIASALAIILSTATLGHFFKFDFSGSMPGGLIGGMLDKFLIRVIGSTGILLLSFTILWIAFCVLCKLPLLPTVLAAVLAVKEKILLSWEKFRSKVFSKKREYKIEENIANQIFEEDVALSSQAAVKSDDENVFWEQVLPSSSDDKDLGIVKNEKTPKTKLFQLPSINIFVSKKIVVDNTEQNKESQARAEKLEEKLLHFGVRGKVETIKPGPVITLFEYKPEIDSKISKITSLEDDLAMVLTAPSIRILAPIPGKNAIGFEIANALRQDVLVSQIFEAEDFKKSKAKLPVVFGVDVVGNPVVEDLVKMPHLLVGGATGSGKSVGLNAMLVSLLCQRKPEDLKLILVDPKRLEFTPYADIPHLLFPIVTEPNRAVQVLKWVVQEMEERYEIMSRVGVRNVVEYQKLEQEGRSASDGHLLRAMPFIVVIIDELADLMIVAGKDVEMQIVRIAQMARAAGIHMIVATQRPSVDVVTGLIKVNFPSRVAFRVSSKVDSRTILDATGAEKLLGRGDMLYMNSASSDLKRVHGAYVSDSEIEKLADHLREQGVPQYLNLSEVLKTGGQEGQVEDLNDELYPQILEFVQLQEEISISMIQRKYAIGFNRSARIIEKLELDGVIAPAQGSKPRKVLRG
jgi:S-DNA-T family DNA segregation ATPase FtsK/SpoIIIE